MMRGRPPSAHKGKALRDYHQRAPAPSIAAFCVAWRISPSTAYRWLRQEKFATIAAKYPDTLSYRATLTALCAAGANQGAAEKMLGQRRAITHQQLTLPCVKRPAELDYHERRALAREWCNDKIALHEIAKRLGVEPRTVRRYLRQ